MSLDGLFESEEIGYIKMDIEGAEKAALEGADKLLERAGTYAAQSAPTTAGRMRTAFAAPFKTTDLPRPPPRDICARTGRWKLIWRRS